MIHTAPPIRDPPWKSVGFESRGLLDQLLVVDVDVGIVEPVSRILCWHRSGAGPRLTTAQTASERFAGEKQGSCPRNSPRGAAGVGTGGGTEDVGFTVLVGDYGPRKRRRARCLRHMSLLDLEATPCDCIARAAS